MHPLYFETQFRCEPTPSSWPEEFVLVTGYATTSEEWPQEINESADRALKEELEAHSCLLCRVTGVSPTTKHEEPGWAATLPWEEACELGLRFKQDAIYVITNDVLWVTHCDVRRRLIRVGNFRERIL
jgi:Protein of unknown function (DUF3293)